jgi:hypothetical protein
MDIKLLGAPAEISGFVSTKLRNSCFFPAMLVAAIAAAQQPPYLYLRQVTTAGVQTLARNHAIQVANHDRIHLQICIRARNVAEKIEQPEVRAANQDPGYFAHRPGPNISLSIQHVIGNERQDVPFRLNSSGLGKDLDVYWVDADIDILEEKAARLQKAEQLVTWIASQPGGERQSQLLQHSPGTLAIYFEEQYINNPPGDYQITAKYTPTTGQNGSGGLTSAPVRIHVMDAGDFFDALKTKLVPR